MLFNVRKEKLGTEDIELGFDTVEQSRGTINSFNAFKIPYNTLNSVGVELDTKPDFAYVDGALVNKEPLGGDNTTVFKALDGVVADDVVTKGQLDTLDASTYSQAEIDASLVLKSDKTNTMALDGTTASPDYSIAPNTVPANKQYVLDTVVGIGAGDMTKAVYDANTSGVVDTTEGVGLATHHMGVSPYTKVMRVSQATFLDANAEDDFGIYIGTDVTNAPASGRVIVEQWIDSVGDKLQRAYSYTTSKWYKRRYDFGALLWSVWVAEVAQSAIDAINAELLLKADITYVDTEILTRVEKTSDTGSAKTPVGTTAQRDVIPSAGMFRFNSETLGFEGHDGVNWGNIGRNLIASLVQANSNGQYVISAIGATLDLSVITMHYTDGFVDGGFNVTYEELVNQSISMTQPDGTYYIYKEEGIAIWNLTDKQPYFIELEGTDPSGFGITQTHIFDISSGKTWVNTTTDNYITVSNAVSYFQAPIEIVGNVLVKTGNRMTADYLNPFYSPVIQAGEFRGINACTAWVVFDGETTPPTIKDSFNVDSIVRTATGRFTIYFTEDMDNVNYAPSGSIGDIDVGAVVLSLQSEATKIVSSVDIRTENLSGTSLNLELVTVNIFGGKS